MKKEEKIDSGSIIDIGTSSADFCYAHMNNPPGTAYKLNGVYFKIIENFNSDHKQKEGRTATELYRNSNLSWTTVIKVLKELSSLKILISNKKGNSIVYHINYKDFHFHSKNTLVLFNTFWRP